MNTKSNHVWALACAAVLAVAMPAIAGEYMHCTVGLGGYDAVSYHQASGPMRGNGNFVAEHEGVTYLFASQENLDAFKRKPDYFAPMYGGFCAYGVSVGKKFVGDPEVWKIVDDRLYLNLDKKIQGLWKEDIEGNIAKAEEQWPQISDKAPAEL